MVLIVPPNLHNSVGTVTSGPPVLIAMCGQDIEITTFTDLIFFKLTCSQFNGTRVLCNVTTPLQVGAFKIAKLQKKTQNTVQVQKSWEIKSGS